MRRIVYFIGVLCSVCLIGGLSNGAASADTISISQTITVKAVIAPARYVIVNSSGRILSVLSNTEESVIPSVYLDTIQSPKQRLTPVLQKQYQAILAAHKGSSVGTVYTYKPKPVTSVASLVKTNFSVVSSQQLYL
jgi:hypothetical protein